jgi:DNA-directed RNA polymerase subunit RPC12/RpoP
MSPLTLESELKRAAAEVDWSRVVHRCAWCKRVADAQGYYVASVGLDEATVMTDGMCPACGVRALAKLTARRLAREPLAA